MKNSLHVINNRLHKRGEMISKHEKKSTEIIQTKLRRES